MPVWLEKTGLVACSLMEDCISQPFAPITTGNSGGALLDSSGKLIGMNTAIYSPSGASSGIGFAIPVDTVRFITETLLRDGQGKHAR